jgi:adenylate cyclase
MFGRFVSPEVVAQLVEDEDESVLRGRTLPLTVLFSDIVRFTSISESMAPDDLFQLLSEYLGAMTDEVLKTGGTLDKYIGDAVMAFWGAPYPGRDAPRRAVEAARAMMQRLERCNADWASRGFPAISIRVGIATGTASVGAIGSEARVDYTAIGDTVNLASRLEGANKHFGSQILVCGSTRKELPADIPTRDLGDVLVIGRKTPVRVHEILTGPGLPAPERVSDFARGREAFDAKDFAEARRIFGALSEGRPDDAVVKTFLDLARKYEENPPETWTAAFELPGK